MSILTGLSAASHEVKAMQCHVIDGGQDPTDVHDFCKFKVPASARSRTRTRHRRCSTRPSWRTMSHPTAGPAAPKPCHLAGRPRSLLGGGRGMPPGTLQAAQGWCTDGQAIYCPLTLTSVRFKQWSCSKRLSQVLPPCWTQPLLEWLGQEGLGTLEVQDQLWCGQILFVLAFTSLAEIRQKQVCLQRYLQRPDQTQPRICSPKAQML